MSDNLKAPLIPWGGILMSIIFVISVIAEMNGLPTQYAIALKVLMIISTLAVFVFEIRLIKVYRLIPEYRSIEEKKDELNKQVAELDAIRKNIETENEKLYNQLQEVIKRCEFLELLVCDGKKFLDNKATIIFDIQRNKYLLSFEKRYIIISEAIKWYEGQFYSNSVLENAEKSQDYYRNHQVSWEELNISAELRFKNVGDEHFSRNNQVTVLRVAEGNNYKKFHIQYRTKDGDKLKIKQGAEIILNYSYEVPVVLWGSYLNRYISYWGETTSVTAICSDSKRITKEYFKVYQTDNQTGDKYICEDAYISEDCIHKRKEITFRLPQKPASQYSIWWNANKIFGFEDKNTHMTADQSQLTHY